MKPDFYEGKIGAVSLASAAGFYHAFTPHVPELMVKPEIPRGHGDEQIFGLKVNVSLVQAAGLFHKIFPRVSGPIVATGREYAKVRIRRSGSSLYWHPLRADYRIAIYSRH